MVPRPRPSFFFVGSPSLTLYECVVHGLRPRKVYLFLSLSALPLHPTEKQMALGGGRDKRESLKACLHTQKQKQSNYYTVVHTATSPHPFPTLFPQWPRVCS